MSGLSSSAPVGQAPTQARQRVQPSVSTVSVPKGAPRRQRQDVQRFRCLAVQVTQRQHGASTLAAHGQEGSRRRRGLGRQAVECGLHRLGVALVQNVDAPAAVAETLHDGFRQADLPGETGQLVLLVRTDQDGDLPGAIGQGSGQEVDADLRHLIHREGQGTGRQAAAQARHHAQHLGAVAGVVQHQQGILAARRAIGGQQRAQSLQQAVAGRQLIGGRPGRADRSAGATAGADLRVDLHRVAGRDDGRGRTDVQAAGAAGLTAAGMSAEAAVEPDVARFFELAEQVGEISKTARSTARGSPGSGRR